MTSPEAGGLLLRPFTAPDLDVVAPWDVDTETRRRLGGPGWRIMVLRANAVLPDASTWLAWGGGRPVALAGFDVVEDAEAGLGSVTAPEARRQGWATAALRLVTERPEAARARRFRAGAEEGNAASAALLRGLGFSEEGALDAGGGPALRAGRPGLGAKAALTLGRRRPVTSGAAAASWWQGVASSRLPSPAPEPRP